MTSTTNAVDFQAFYPWITNEFFERILRRDQQDETIIVHGYTLKAALGKGENYLSQMLRTTVEYTKANATVKSTIGLIIKAVLSDPNMASLTTELDVFRKEIRIYQEVIPAVERLLRSIGDDQTRISAKCYDANVEQSYLVFEDLAVAGYKNANRRTGLDVAHFKRVFSKLAKWHAATAMLIEGDDSADLFANNKKSCHETDMMRSLFVNFGRAMPEVVEQLDGLQHLAPKLRTLAENIYERVLAATATDPNTFTVLTHGDMWSNNIMFRYGGGGGGDDEIEDAILVDFQICYVGSPVLDLVYTMYSSSAFHLRAADWDELIRHYSDELSVTLKRLGYEARPIPTLADLQADRMKRSHHALMLGMYAMGVRNLDTVADDELSKMLGDSEESHRHRIAIMMNPKIRDALRHFLEFFDTNGFFD